MKSLKKLEISKLKKSPFSKVTGAGLSNYNGSFSVKMLDGICDQDSPNNPL